MNQMDFFSILVRSLQTFICSSSFLICMMGKKKRTLKHGLKDNTFSIQFKSRGERKLAYFLEENNIKYKHESGVLIYQAEVKPRIWYPGFNLPEFGTSIEYNGMVGNPDYDRGIRVKESTYSKMGLDVILVYPHMSSEDWQGYIITEIKRKIQRQYDTFMSKPFNTKIDIPFQNSMYNTKKFY